MSTTASLFNSQEGRKTSVSCTSLLIKQKIGRMLMATGTAPLQVIYMIYQAQDRRMTAIVIGFVPLEQSGANRHDTRSVPILAAAAQTHGVALPSF